MKVSPLNRRRVLHWGSALGMLGAVRLAPAAAANNSATGTDALVGSWIVAISYSTSGDDTHGLATFSRDGGFIGSISAFDGTPTRPTPSRGTTLHGTWQQVNAPHSYDVAAARLHLDAQGIWFGTMRTRIHLTLDSHDSWSGNYVFEARTPSGSLTRTGNGTLQATRIPGTQ